MRKRLTKKEGKEIAEKLAKDIRKARDLMQEILNDEDYRKLTTVYESKYLVQAIDKLNDYNSATDDRCFRKGYVESIYVFYSSTKETESKVICND